MTDNPTAHYWLNDFLAQALQAGTESPAHTLARSIEQFVADGHLTHFRYPVLPSPRYGWGRPSHRVIEEKILADLPAIRQRLSSYNEMAGLLSGVARELPNPDNGQPFWGNVLLPVIDAVSICGMIREFSPQRFVEIGSGNSTRFARHAIEGLGLSCEITSIDPYPGDTIVARSDHPVRQPLEGADLAIFDTLQPGDIVWMDGTHRSYSNTDVSVFAFDVLPRLRPGVIVGVHDITLPWDYPPSWDGLFFNENYVVGAYLLGALDRVEFLLPSLYVNHIALGPRAAVGSAGAGRAARRAAGRGRVLVPPARCRQDRMTEPHGID